MCIRIIRRFKNPFLWWLRFLLRIPWWIFQPIQLFEESKILLILLNNFLENFQRKRQWRRFSKVKRLSLFWIDFNESFWRHKLSRIQNLKMSFQTSSIIHPEIKYWNFFRSYKHFIQKNCNMKYNRSSFQYNENTYLAIKYGVAKSSGRLNILAQYCY